MRGLRLIAGFVLLAVAVVVMVAVFRPEPVAAEARVFTSSAQCRDCHAQQYSEWSSSWHAQAWNDPDVRALSNDFANSDCIDCHAPRPVFETGLGSRVLPRSARRPEGVDCIACHMLPEGAPGLMAGTIDVPSAPCRPTATTDLARVEFCAPCHDQHKTVTQWRESKWAEQGVTCVDCHMPVRPGASNRGRDHTMHGGHDIELVRRAVTLEAKRDGRIVRVAVENVGAGHHFPTDERSRAGDLFWRPLARDGANAEPWRFVYRFRSPYRHEVDLVDTLLPANARHEQSIDVGDVSGPIEVALFYKLTPYWADPEHPDPDRESRLVHRVAVEP